MIDLVVGQTIILKSGKLFKVLEAHPVWYVGEVSYGYGMIKSFITRSTGIVRDTMTNTHIDDFVLDESLFRFEKTCDCGGFKTYKTYNKEFHSNWCKVNHESNSI